MTSSLNSIPASRDQFGFGAQMESSSGSSPPRVVIADESELIVLGLQSIFGGRFRVIATFSNGDDLVHAAPELRPDVIVLSDEMPSGANAARRVRRVLPYARLIVLTRHTNPEYLRLALNAGVNGYVLTTASDREVIEAMNRVLAGETYISPAFSPRVIANLRTNGGALRENHSATERQREVLQHIAHGKTSKEIAHMLNISAKTVDFHRTRLLERFGAGSAAELVRIAVEENLLIH